MLSGSHKVGKCSWNCVLILSLLFTRQIGEGGGGGDPPQYMLALGKVHSTKPVPAFKG